MECRNYYFSPVIANISHPLCYDAFRLNVLVRKTITKIIEKANHCEETYKKANENAKLRQFNCLKRGKTRVTKPRLVLIVNLIG